MPDKEIVYKKFYRQKDKHLNGQIEAKHGKQEHHKLKPYLVLQYLMHQSDADNIKSSYDIIGYLEEKGLTAERRSIYRDIEEINLVNIMVEYNCNIKNWTHHRAKARK